MMRSLFSIFHFPSSVQKGFSLIELIVVIGVMGVLTAVSIASFSTYSDTRSFDTGVAEVMTVLQTAKSRSLSQVKPDSCTGRSLQGYRVTLSLPSTYQLQAFCGGNTYTVEQKTLPRNVTFASGSTTATTFTVLTGTPNTSSITINGFSKTRTITVSSSGNIMVN